VHISPLGIHQMARRPPPLYSKRLAGESHSHAALRTLAENPNSPASLRLISAMQKALAPYSAANDDVMQALAAQLERDGPDERADVEAAIQQWELVCDGPMCAVTRHGFESDARGLRTERRGLPPEMASILISVPEITDTGYELGVHFDGLKGTWHSLWKLVLLNASSPNLTWTAGGLNVVRKRFEANLGRPLEAVEWSRLEALAKTRV